jgi:hypothetical protein
MNNKYMTAVITTPAKIAKPQRLLPITFIKEIDITNVLTA